MAVPKRRTSRARRDKRRAHDALKAPTLGVCPRCGEPKLPHRVCSGCGTYRDRQVLSVDDGD
ncbi:MAG: 50S ribosomal protein L32 [Myxococcota bacterium]